MWRLRNHSPRADHDLAALRIEADHEQRLRRRHADPSPLPDGVIDDALVAAEHAPIHMHDVARLGGPWAKPLDDVRVASGGHEADVLAIGLLRRGETEVARELARRFLVQIAKRKAQELELLARGGEQEIALVALGVAGPVELEAPLPWLCSSRNGPWPEPAAPRSLAVRSRSRNLIF